MLSFTFACAVNLIIYSSFLPTHFYYLQLRRICICICVGLPCADFDAFDRSPTFAVSSALWLLYQSRCGAVRGLFSAPHTAILLILSATSSASSLPVVPVYVAVGHSLHICDTGCMHREGWPYYAASSDRCLTISSHVKFKIIVHLILPYRSDRPLRASCISACLTHIQF
jgi:hypothetical protein